MGRLEIGRVRRYVILTGGRDNRSGEEAVRGGGGVLSSGREYHANRFPLLRSADFFLKRVRTCCTDRQTLVPVRPPTHDK